MSFQQLRSTRRNPLQVNECPVVTTQATSSITSSTATGNGTVISVGGSALTERGVCWSTSINPTVADSKATSAGQAGAFTASITGLIGGTQYFVRAYAINGTCTEYGDNDTFTATAATLPYNQYDWPDPRGYVPSIDLRTWAWKYTQAAGSDTFFGLAGHPNFDWPVPKGPQRSIDLLSWAQSPLIRTVVPNAQLDWPNPRGPQRSIDLLTWFQSPLIRTVKPFAQTDWPVPKGPTPSIDLRTWTESLTYIIGQDVFFGLAGHPNFDWPNPRGPQYPTSLRTWDQGNLENTLLFNAQPFGPYDWPNPRGATPAIDLRTWLQGFYELAGQDTFFGLAGHPNYDWPNPRGAQRPPLTWDQSALLATLLAQNQPFGPYDWPNPRGPIPAIDLKTWTESLTYLIGQDQFFGLAGHPNFDWPNPRGPQHPQQWQQPSLNELLLTGAFPFSQLDWPNPTLRNPDLQLRTWLNMVRLLLLGQDQFFGLAGHPNFNWPNPPGPPPLVPPLIFPTNPNLLPPTPQTAEQLRQIIRFAPLAMGRPHWTR